MFGRFERKKSLVVVHKSQYNKDICEKLTKNTGLCEKTHYEKANKKARYLIRTWVHTIFNKGSEVKKTQSLDV